MAGKRKSPYSGALNEPIRVPQPLRLGLWSETSEGAKAAVDKIRRQIMAEWWAKFALLLNHYGIKAKYPEFQWKLILSLISDHMPGMRVSYQERRGPEKRGPGRPRQKWGLPGLSFERELVRQVDSQRKNGRRLYEAIRDAKTKSAAKKKRGTNEVETAVYETIAWAKAGSLENSYREAKLRIELDELVAKNTLVNTSSGRSQTIAALFDKVHTKKRKEKH